MHYLTLPIDVRSITEDDIKNLSIDMSDLRFPCKEEYMIRSAFIFFRNINKDFNLDFSKCTYEQKESYILMYLQGNIEVNIKPIIDTWMDILISKYTVKNDILGFLTREDINLFCDRNNQFINEIHELIASLILLGVYNYSKSDATGAKFIDINDDFESLDYDKINFYNLSLLTNSEYFGILLQDSKTIKPKFYSKYFNDNNQLAISIINDNLPFINLLNIFFAPKEIQDNFINELNKMITPEEGLSDE